MRVTSAEANIRASHRVEEMVVSDNRPHVSAEIFRVYSQENNFTHITSRPRYPQTNREVERAIQTMNNLWKRDMDHSRAPLAYQATSLEHGFSPGQLLMGSPLRTSLPQTITKLDPKRVNVQTFPQN